VRLARFLAISLSFPFTYPDLWLREIGLAFDPRGDDAPLVVRPA